MAFSGFGSASGVRNAEVQPKIRPGAQPFFRKSFLAIALDWWLAVPKQRLKTFFPDPAPPVCSECGEPKTWSVHFGELWTRMQGFDSEGIDIFRPKEWYGSCVEKLVETVNSDRAQQGKRPLPWSNWAEWGVSEPPPHPERWSRIIYGKDLYFSVRLDLVFQRANVKGVGRDYTFDQLMPTPEDSLWVEEKLGLLADHGLLELRKRPSKTKNLSPVERWFVQFLKKSVGNKERAVEFAGIETEQMVQLPQHYKDFISTLGSRSFPDVNELEGATTRILPPNKLNFRHYRRGKMPDLQGESAEVDGVVFAEVDSGDCFIFDVASKDGNYPVYFYNHEENSLQPFAPNFAECIKRFAQKN